MDQSENAENSKRNQTENGAHVQEQKINNLKSKETCSNTECGVEIISQSYEMPQTSVQNGSTFKTYLELQKSVSTHSLVLENNKMPPTVSKEICTNVTNLCDLNLEYTQAPKPQSFIMESLHSNSSNENVVTTGVNTSPTLIPLITVSEPSSCVVIRPNDNPPVLLRSDLPSMTSMSAGQPQSLFLQALSKVNESSLSVALMNHFRNSLQVTNSCARPDIPRKLMELSPPDSITSAPPSYSFVLRQMAVRRPRILGTFIPSPSFVQHTPPPNYAAAFDIYVDNPIMPAPRVHTFGFASMPIVCPDCGHTGMTVVTSKITICTHLCAVILCIFCCWICVPLPYMLRSCKDVYHYCRNCRNYLGMYCPTNPANAVS